jgi:hypothetical protein
MSVKFEAMDFHETVVSAIDASPVTSAEELITFQVVHRQGLLVIIYIVSNETFSKMAILKMPHDI